MACKSKASNHLWLLCHLFKKTIILTLMKQLFTGAHVGCYFESLQPLFCKGDCTVRVVEIA